jgi:ribonuclease BN (tRNA processing enzyme)
LGERLTRYLSPPLFPVHLRDLPWVQLHELCGGEFDVGPFHVSAAFVCHANPTLGYRVAAGGATLAYLPDHEPALGSPLPLDREPFRSGAWTSGYALAAGADLLIHDAQYDDDEYATFVGRGHSSMRQAFAFAALASAGRLVPFHHDPAHTDDDLDRLLDATVAAARPQFAVLPGVEGAEVQVNAASERRETGPPARPGDAAPQRIA